MKMWAQKQKGFTIVELVIVIIVIGILAAISVVSYNGVTTRAENVKTIDAVSKYVDTLIIHKAATGSYPPTSSVAACLGTANDGRCGNITDVTSAGCGMYSRAGYGSEAFNDGIKSSLGNVLPEPSSQVLTCYGKQYQGAYFNIWNETDAGVTYYLRGNQPCDMLRQFRSVDKTQTGNITVCTGMLDS